MHFPSTPGRDVGGSEGIQNRASLHGSGIHASVNLEIESQADLVSSCQVDPDHKGPRMPCHGFDCFPVGTGQHCRRAQGVNLGLRAPCCECRLELGGHGGDPWRRLQRPRVCLESQAQPRLFLGPHLLVTRWLRHWDAFTCRRALPAQLGLGPWGPPQMRFGSRPETLQPNMLLGFITCVSQNPGA